MRFSNHGSMAMAMAASLATASPHHPIDIGYPHQGLDLGKPIHASVDLNADLSGKVLVAGVLADIIVDPIAEVKAGAKVAVVCEDCHIKGDIDASISLKKVVPALSLSLKDVEVLLDLDVYIGAAATIAVNLVTPAKVSLPLPGLNVEALVYLDLILGVHTELDLSAGIYVSLPEAYLETDILSGNILDVDFTGVAVKVLPIKVRIGCTELLADLRLRVDLGVSAVVDAGEILPLSHILPGLDIPAIGAGLELAVYANLLEYVGLFCAAPECPLAEEAYGLNVGAAVELGVAVEDLLSIHLAPTVATAVLSIPTNTICIPTYTASPPAYTASLPPYSGLPTPSGPEYGVPTATLPGDLPGGLPSSIPGSGPGGLPSSIPGGFPGGLPTSSGLPGDLPSTLPGGLPGGVPTSGGAGFPSVTASGSDGVVLPTVTAVPGGDDGLTTSTITNTQTFTVTACAANVPNCPAGYQTSVTLTHTTSFTTVCPISETAAITAPPAPTATGGHDIQTITKHVTTMVPCDSTSTFVPPTEISTVPFPSNVPTHVASSSAASSAPSSPAGGNSGSVPAGYPVPTASGPAGSPVATASESSPAGISSVSYPVRNYPVGGAEASYPAGGPSHSYPAPVTTGAAFPTPVPAPSGPVYPSGGNGTVPATSGTYEPTVTGPAGYPTGPAATTPVMAGAGKFGSSIAAVVALVGAVMVL